DSRELAGNFVPAREQSPLTLAALLGGVLLFRAGQLLGMDDGLIDRAAGGAETGELAVIAVALQHIDRRDRLAADLIGGSTFEDCPVHSASAGLLFDILKAAIDDRVERIELALDFSVRHPAAASGRSAAPAVARAGRAGAERARRNLARCLRRARPVARRFAVAAPWTLRNRVTRTPASVSRSRRAAVAGRCCSCRSCYCFSGSVFGIRRVASSLAQARCRAHCAMAAPPIPQPQGAPLRPAFRGRLRLRCTGFGRRALAGSLGGRASSRRTIRARPSQLRRPPAAPPTPPRAWGALPPEGP